MYQARYLYALTLFGLLSLACAVAAPRTPANIAEPTGCPEVPALAGKSCVPSEYAWVFAGEREAAAFAQEVDEAAASFQRYFGALPAHGAVVISDGVSADALRQLEEAGAAWVMPMISKARLAALGSGGQAPGTSEQEIRDQAREQLQRQLGEVPQALLDQVVAQAMAQAKDAPSPSSGSSEILRTNPLSHELGHLWLGELFDPEHEPEDSHVKYGWGLPDWLDETAAILMENEVLTESRRRSFADNLKAGRQIPLPDFFTMSHPSFSDKEIQEALREAGSSGGVTVLTLQKGGGDSAVAMLTFYSQARAFADYLIEKTGEPRIFGEIARALSEGQPLDGWLSSNAARFGLPTMLDGLDEDFRRWTQ